jgi:hypothetical protein
MQRLADGLEPFGSQPGLALPDLLGQGDLGGADVAAQAAVDALENLESYQVLVDQLALDVPVQEIGQDSQ